MVWKWCNVSEISLLIIIRGAHISRHSLASHFWLNEGWTTYMERLLQQKLHSPAHRGFFYLLGAKGLKEALNNFANRPKYQRLVIDFENGEGKYLLGFLESLLVLYRPARSG
jgi:hypothetical protein